MNEESPPSLAASEGITRRLLSEQNLAHSQGVLAGQIHEPLSKCPYGKNSNLRRSAWMAGYEIGELRAAVRELQRQNNKKEVS